MSYIPQDLNNIEPPHHPTTNELPDSIHGLASERGSARVKYLASLGGALLGVAMVLGPTHDAMARQEGQRVTADAIEGVVSPTQVDILQAQKAGEAASEDYTTIEWVADIFIRNRNKWQLWKDVQFRNPDTGKHDSKNTQANLGTLLALAGYFAMGLYKRDAKEELRYNANAKMYIPPKATFASRSQRQANTPLSSGRQEIERIAVAQPPTLPKRDEIPTWDAGGFESRAGIRITSEQDPLKTDEQTILMGQLVEDLLRVGGKKDVFSDPKNPSVFRQFTDSINGRTYVLRMSKFIGHGTRGTITVQNIGQAGVVNETYTVYHKLEPGGNLPMIDPPVSSLRVALSINEALQRQMERDEVASLTAQASVPYELPALIRRVDELTD